MALHIMEEADRCLGCKKPRCRDNVNKLRQGHSPCIVFFDAGGVFSVKKS